MTNEYRHIPVLLDECLSGLELSAGKTFVDATLGGAGHSLEAAKLIGATGHLIGIDQDQVALDAATARLFALPDEIRPEIDVLYGNFGMLDELLVEAEVPQIDAILFDIGVSSVQIDTPSRGFSFKENGPLDMRMNPSKHTITAAEIINTKNATDLARIIRSYSDEKWANRIAEFIVKTREKAPITESQQLVEIIKAAIPASARRSGGHPAKRTFQALRIEVNGELDMLRSGLEAAIRLACSRGTHRGHQLSFARRSHRQRYFQRVRQRLHLSARSARLRVWKQADTRDHHPQAHRAER